MIYAQYLGSVPYSLAYKLQRITWSQRVNGEIPDQLLLLEHPPVITLGCQAKFEHLRVPMDLLQQRGIEVVETDRGGDVTYHGPGQLIGYPIIDLKPDRMDVLRYLRDLEDVLIRTLRSFGVIATRHPKYTGVWVEDRKIAALGVKISRWVTYHGFALNVNTNLSAFDLIVPCGIADCRVTSMEKELGCMISLAEVVNTVVAKFSEIFLPTEICNRTAEVFA